MHEATGEAVELLCFFYVEVIRQSVIRRDIDHSYTEEREEVRSDQNRTGGGGLKQTV